MGRTSTHCHYFPLSPSPTIRNPESCRKGAKNYYYIATLLACRRRSLPSTSRAMLKYLVIIPQSRIIFFLVAPFSFKNEN